MSGKGSVNRGSKSQESSRRNSVSISQAEVPLATPQNSLSQPAASLTEDRVGKLIDQKLAAALGPVIV